MLYFLYQLLRQNIKVLYKYFRNRSFNGNNDINNIHFQVVSLFVWRNKMQNSSYLCSSLVFLVSYFIYSLWPSSIKNCAEILPRKCHRNKFTKYTTSEICFHGMSIIFAEWITFLFVWIVWSMFNVIYMNHSI